MPDVLLQIEEWKRRLIDLTKRNQLIYFNLSRKGILGIVHPDLYEILNRLLEEKEFNVWLPPEEDKDNEEELFEDENASHEEKSRDNNYRQNEIVFNLDGKKEIEKRLKAIYRQAKSDYNEKGTRTSVITFGLLHWKERSTEEEVVSPLLLCPIEIVQATPYSPYKVKIADEEMILNPSIQVKLKYDFNIQLPAPNFENESWNINEYFKAVEKLGSRVGWFIENKAFMGIFSFHKMAMYQDLTDNASIMASHSVIKGLTDGYLSERPEIAADIPDERELDKDESPNRMLYIRDADSSQSRAIEAALRGHSFVLKGPPGTGKSQTISNIIAEFLEEGKTVLFVSEKMAALEVVFERIKKAGLGDFCLELHSHKVNRKQVVYELARCLEERPIPRQHITESELGRLVNLRRKLNEYILALHEVREPLQESMFQVFGKLAKLANLPTIQMKFKEEISYSPANIQFLEELVNKLKSNWIVISEGRSFPWRGFKISNFSPDLRTELLSLLEKIRIQIIKLRSLFSDYTTGVGLEEPQSISGCEWVTKISKMLLNNPAPIKKWLSESENARLLLDAEKLQELHKVYQELKDRILQEFSSDFIFLPADTKVKFVESWSEVKNLLSKKDEKGEELLGIHKELLQFVRKSQNYIDGWLRDVRFIRDYLGLTLNDEFSIGRAKQILRIGLLCFFENKPEKHWLDPITIENIESTIGKIRLDCEKYHSINSDILSKYQQAFFTLDLDRLIKDYESKYGSLLRYLFLRYYLDKARIRKTCISRRIPISILSDLNRAKELNLLREKFDSLNAGLKELLGNYYKGFETNFERVEAAYKVAKEIVNLIGEIPVPEKVIKAASLGTIAHPDLEINAKRLEKSISEWLSESERFSSIISADCLSVSNLSLLDTPISKIKTYFNELLPVLDKFYNISSQILKTKIDNGRANCLFIIEKLTAKENIKAFEFDIERESDQLKENFGNMFIGVDTNWKEIIEAILWTKDFINFTKDMVLPEEFVSRLTGGFRTRNELILELESILAESKSIISKLDDYFDEGSSGRGKFINFIFDDLNNRIIQFLDRIDDLQFWVDYKEIVTKMSKNGLGEFLEAICLNPPHPNHIINILHKAIYQSWTNKICDEDKIISEFRGIDHERAINEFRQIDKKLNAYSSSLIIDKLNKNRPKLIDIEGSAISIIRDEAAKRRRHLPVRKLFDKIATLLLKLKPCLLMSPLSVSHFINPKLHHFDLVIFDEASQICSEDAVGAICRGRQLVVAGDNKQLPPTKFFQSEILEDYDEDDQAPYFGVYQSILDDCERIGLTQNPLMLKWHYRSKHESLIAYSNCKFYENKLVTFPCSKDIDTELGIKFRYVSDGVFDRGGKRNNLKEAEVVVDLVFEHFQKYGDKKTLGVATLNLPQKELIYDVIEQRLRLQPESAKFFTEDRLSGFFVKNLENVQGDERDVIILSLGYGKDAQGRLTMNFGPINREGGERRLNVIVTRAREKLVLVSSIKASDFDINNLNAEGVRHLYFYLNYAEKGKEALLIEGVYDEETESPLEQDVKDQILSMGYNVISQVGCSSFRIDLGVIDPAHPGCFILGVECDGATYHSGFTARERDRLRQEVLEDLGWKIHRIWAPDWYFRRKHEIDRLKSVIEEDKSGGHCVKFVSQDSHQIDLSYGKNKIEQLNSGSIAGIEGYKCFSGYTRKSYPSYEFNLIDSCNKRMQVLIEIVEREGPIHIELATKRLLTVWGIGRVGSVIEETIERTVKNCQRGGDVFKKGKFLWSNKDFRIRKVRVPVRDDADTFRDPEYVCIEELELAMRLIIEKSLGIKRESLFTEVGKLFGWERITSTVEEAISKVFKELLKNKKIIVSEEDMVHLGDVDS